jgi:Tfp pilus assembly protein PilN
MILAVAAGVLVVVVFIGIYLLRVAKITALKGELKTAQAELKKYDAALAKVQKIEAEKKRLETQLGVITSLIEARLDYPVMMEVITRKDFLPANARINTFSATADANGIKFAFNVEAADNYSVADLLANLEKSPLFSEVTVSGFASAAAAGPGLSAPRTMSVTCLYTPERSKK